MTGRTHLLLPLMSSVIYVVGALWVRRAADLGVGIWRMTFVSNVSSAVLFAFVPLVLGDGPGQPLTRLWQPAVLAGLLVAGQILGFISLSRGDVTIATPVLGVKTVLVALLVTAVLGTPVSGTLWAGAVLGTLAIALLSGSRGGPHRRIGLTLGTGLAAAAAFALFDVGIQRWAPVWGAGRLLPLVMSMAATGSIGLMPMFREPLARIPKPAWRPLLVGASCISVQGLLLISSVALFGDATAINIVYASRSLWMVIVVWAVGHWFHSSERHLGRRVLGRRLCGAALMTTAVILALSRP